MVLSLCARRSFSLPGGCWAEIDEPDCGVLCAQTQLGIVAPMLRALLPLLIALEPPAVDPVAEGGDEPRDAPTDAAASSFVEDMPDPYAGEWEPPEGPTKPPPEIPSSPVPPASSTGVSGTSTTPELPPPSGVPTGSPDAVRYGQRLQVAGLVFGAGGGIGLAMGVYLFDELGKTRATLAGEQALLDLGTGSPARVAELETRVERQRQAMVISLAAGGSALGLGVILLASGTAVKSRAAKAATTWLSPGPGLVGLAIGRRF